MYLFVVYEKLVSAAVASVLDYRV